MGIGYRIFVVEDDNAVLPVSQKSFSDFYFRHIPSLQRFAGRTINFAVVFYTLEKRKPKQIIRIDSERVIVNSDGAIDQEHHFDKLRLAANRLGPIFGEEPRTMSSGPLVNAVAKFDERRWSQLHPRLSGPAQKQILEALFGAKHAV